MIEIRRMTMEDVPEVVEIDRSSFTLPWSERAFRHEVTENAGARCWVLTEGGRVISTAIIWMILDEAHVATIATHPHFRRRGFAKALLTHSLLAAREEGAAQALLEVRAHHEAAQRIYREIGFVEVGRRPRYYRDNGEDAVLMTLEDLKNL
jgi:[ribosomal protein S18]-alanine N-acetyltransferase